MLEIVFIIWGGCLWVLVAIALRTERQRIIHPVYTPYSIDFKRSKSI